MPNVGIPEQIGSNIAIALPYLIPFSMPANGTLDSASVWVYAQSGGAKMRVAVYSGGTSDTDPSGATLVTDLGQLSSLSVPALGTLTAASESLVSGTRYWIGIKSVSTSNQIYSGAGATQDDFAGYFVQATGASNDPTAAWESTVPSGASVQVFKGAVYITYTAAGGIAIPVFMNQYRFRRN